MKAAGCFMASTAGQAEDGTNLDAKD